MKLGFLRSPSVSFSVSWSGFYDVDIYHSHSAEFVEISDHPRHGDADTLINIDADSSRNQVCVSHDTAESATFYDNVAGMMTFSEHSGRLIVNMVSRDQLKV